MSLCRRCFVATTKKDDYLLAFFPKIHPIAGTKGGFPPFL